MIKQLVVIVLVLCTGALCFLLAADSEAVQGRVRDYVRSQAAADTGALNLVTAIYLGYRVFDTLGETVVLLLAVIGVNLLFVRER